MTPLNMRPWFLLPFYAAPEAEQAAANLWITTHQDQIQDRSGQGLPPGVPLDPRVPRVVPLMEALRKLVLPQLRTRAPHPEALEVLKVEVPKLFSAILLPVDTLEDLGTGAFQASLVLAGMRASPALPAYVWPYWQPQVVRVTGLRPTGDYLGPIPYTWEIEPQGTR